MRNSIPLPMKKFYIKQFMKGKLFYYRRGDISKFVREMKRANRTKWCNLLTTQLVYNWIHRDKKWKFTF